MTFLNRKSKPKIQRDAFIYLGNTGGDHQCKTCTFLTEHKICTIANKVVEDTWTCCFAIDGSYSGMMPTKLLTFEEMGLYKGQVRCENCRYGGKTCALYTKLNKAFPNEFDLDEKIEPKGCCNAFEPAGSDG